MKGRLQYSMFLDRYSVFNQAKINIEQGTLNIPDCRQAGNDERR
jgi:hypothetical protein